VGALTTGARRLSASTRWSDPETGSTEEAAFLGPSGRGILAFLHRPRSWEIRGGVLLCPSLYEDFQVNYRSELLVARALVRRGFAAVRFHYRGTGNSDDLAGGAITFDTMVDDARTAAAWLSERTDPPRMTTCGSRLGALVASELTRRDHHGPLVLWAPVVDGADFFRGMSRASLLAGVRADARKGRDEGRDDARGASGSAVQGDVERLGNVVHRKSYEDLSRRSLPTGIGAGSRVLLVEFGLGDTGNPQYRDLVARWTAEGALVDELRVRKRLLWMLPDKWEPEEDSPTTREVVEGITGWVDAATREPS
jgi:alpha/beta superfamily hydrolase